MIPKHPRILAIAPSTKGFGFALLEGLKVLVDWGVKSAEGDKNRVSIAKLEKLIAHYQPDVVVLEDTLTKPFRRSVRIRALTEGIIGLAESHDVTVVSFSREQVMTAFFPDGHGTKYARAEIIAKRFDELRFELPPKRRPWESDDSRMGIFDAVALGVLVR